MGLNDYGFLSSFNVDTETARERIRFLFNDSGIVHFQFYDCMERYELPFDGEDCGKLEWENPIGAVVRRETIDACIDEINKIGGNSWFYIPIYGVSPDYVQPGLEDALFTFDQNTQEYVQDWFCLDDNPSWPFVSVVDPSSKRWKEHFTEQLTKVVSELGFQGIHFDQYGSLGNRFNFRYTPREWSFDNSKDHGCFEEIDKVQLMVAFLSYFRDKVPYIGVTFNAVDGYGLRETMHLVVFPYVELFSDDAVVSYSSELSGETKFVIVAYTPFKDGLFDKGVFSARKKIINDAGGSFLHKGDDNRFLVNCYFPAAEKLE